MQLTRKATVTFPSSKLTIANFQVSVSVSNFFILLALGFLLIGYIVLRKAAKNQPLPRHSFFISFTEIIAIGILISFEPNLIELIVSKMN